MREKANDDWRRPSGNELEQIRKDYREIIENDYGIGVLHDLLALPHLGLFEGLEEGVEGSFPSPWDDAATRQRFEEEYGATFEYIDSPDSGKSLDELSRQAERLSSGMFNGEPD